jgi:hypothetical protein
MSTEFTCVVYKGNELVLNEDVFYVSGDDAEMWLEANYPISKGYRYNVRKTGTDVISPMQYAAFSSEFEDVVDAIHARVLATEIMDGLHTVESIEHKIKDYSAYKMTHFVAFCAFCSFWLNAFAQVHHAN